LFKGFNEVCGGCVRAQVDVHTNLGDLWRAQGPSGQAEAQRCYAEALRVDVRHAPAWRGLGDLMRERGQHASAVACYQARASISTIFLNRIVRKRGGHVPCAGDGGNSLQASSVHPSCFPAPGCLMCM
jgi:hypothetical protein